MVITNKNKFNKRYGYKADDPNSKAEISRLTGISMGILNKVMFLMNIKYLMNVLITFIKNAYLHLKLQKN